MAVVVATHSKVLPASCGTAEGQTTVAWTWRLARTVCSIDNATRAVSRLVFAELVEDEPQALINAAQASAVTATVAARGARRPRAALGVGGSMCMRAY